MAIVSLINDAQIIERGQLVIEPIICVSALRVTFNVWNRRFTVDLSGARPRCWKSEFLSIIITNK